MHIFNVSIPDKPMTNIELTTYARELEIPHFRGVFVRDTLPLYPFNIESGIVSFNTSNQAGSCWVCYYRNKTDRIYFDSYGQITHVEIQRYLKTGSEFDRGKEVIQRNTDIMQTANTLVCGHLCLFVLKSLANSEQFQSILNHMQHYGYPKVIGKIPFIRKNASFYQSIVTHALAIHYTCNWTREIIHYRETNHIMLLTLLLYAMTFVIEIIQLVNMNVTVKC